MIKIMSKKKLRSCAVIMVIIFYGVVLGGCSPNKSTIIVEDMNFKESNEENKILKHMNDFKEALINKNYGEAKKAFEGAISIEKKNIGVYNNAKDMYLQNNRYDDAFYVVKLAIKNEVDVINMENQLDKIKEKFKPIELFYDIKEGQKDFNLPKTTKIKVNDEEVVADINWINTGVDTSKVGTFVYVGSVDEYGREVRLHLKINLLNREKVTAFIKSVYEKGGSTYVVIDEVEFYRDQRAVEEAKKDKSDELRCEDGRYYLYNSYYIRNSDKENTRDLKIDENAEIYLCKWRTGGQESSLDLMKVSFDDLRKGEIRLTSLLCYINVVDGKITFIREQYRP